MKQKNEMRPAKRPPGRKIVRMGVRLVVSLEIEQKDDGWVALLETNRPAQWPPERTIVRMNVRLVV